MKYVWKIGGEAGFGIMTTGLSFSKMAARSGYHIFDYAEFPSLIKGGHNTYEVVISDEEVFAPVQHIDLLVCLNRDTYELHKHRVTKDTIVVHDKADFEIDGEGVKVDVPISQFLKELVGPRLMSNTIALGLSLSLLQGDLQVLFDLIEKEFGRKGEDVVTYNKNFAKKGYDYIQEHYKELTKPVFTGKSAEEKLVLTGNDAFSLAAVAADCRFYCAYPMSPSSSILATLAAWEKKTGMVVRHAEDEISVINTALGSSAMGVRSAVGTSGGGFALMVEAISFAGVAEIPIVIFLGQRPGPATGLPTWTEQGDLLFASFSGHGEFPKIVIAPGDMQEMLAMGAQSFDLTDIYQTPVIVMSDKFLSESHKSEDKGQVLEFMNSYAPDRGKIVDSVEAPYLRYKVTDDGISPLLRPGQEGLYYQHNSYEHEENSHTTEDAAIRIQQVDKRNRKRDTYLARHFQAPKTYGDMSADTVFVSWGSLKGPVLEAQKLLRERGVETGFVHFTHVYPLKKDAVEAVLPKDKRLILVENNSTAQFGQLLRMETGIDILGEKYLQYDGRPIKPEELADYVTKQSSVL